MGGDRLAPPRSLTAQLVVARAQIIAARSRGEPEREFYWMQRVDRLLDRYLDGER